MSLPNALIHPNPKALLEEGHENKYGIGPLADKR